MAITFNKFEAYYRIRGLKSLYTPEEKILQIETIIRVALKEFDVNLTEEDIKIMRRDYGAFVFKYRTLI